MQIVIGCDPSCNLRAKRRTEEELEPWVVYRVRATHMADDLLDVQRNHAVDPQTEQDILQTSMND